MTTVLVAVATPRKRSVSGGVDQAGAIGAVVRYRIGVAVGVRVFL